MASITIEVTDVSLDKVDDEFDNPEKELEEMFYRHFSGENGPDVSGSHMSVNVRID